MKSVILFFCFAILLGVSPAWAGSLHIMAEEYPPLAYSKDGKQTGFVLETVRHMLDIMDDDSKIHFTPWLRAYMKIQEEQRQVLFPLIRTPEREERFKWVGPLFSEREYFFKRADSPLVVNSLDDAKAVQRISVVRADYYHITLQRLGFSNLDVGTSHEIALRKLLEGRVDLTPIGERTFSYFIRQKGMDPEMFRKTNYQFDTSYLWIAFSLDVPDSMVMRWQYVLDTLKYNGTHAAIIKRNLAE